MSVFESILYGIVSGIAEFLPVSTQGHQAVLLRLFGQSFRDPLRDVMVHIALLAALLFGCRNFLLRIQREQVIISRSRRKHTYDFNSIYDLRFIKTAAIPFAVGLIAYFRMQRFEQEPLSLVVFFIVNGLALMIPEYIRKGNKTGRLMTGLDGILFGIFSAFSCFPGISRIGCGMGYASIRGADRTHALSWALLLSIPALVLWIVFDIIQLFSFGIAAITFLSVLSYIFSGIFAFIGGFAGISLIRFIAEKSSFLGFSYYSFGIAMFTFVLYLIA